MSAETPRCPDVDALATFESWPAGDPRRAHVASCARCSALRAELLAFAAGDSAAVGATRDELRAANDRLAGVLAAEVAGEVTPTRRADVPRESGSWLARMLAALASPAMRPALAVAVIAIVAGAWWMSRGPRAGGEPELRGATPAGAAVELMAPAAPERGHVTLEWKAASGAEDYRIELLTEELDPLATFGPVAATRYDLGAGAASGVRSGTRALVRVIALRDGQAIAESAMQPLVLP